MEELSIEEKAKAYDEVYKKIAIRFGSNVADEIFSQFEMPEDEKIRKTLIEYFNTYPKDYYCELKTSRIIAWLEKQGEQKPTWSEEDDIKVDSINQVFDCATKHNIVSEDKCLYKLRDWLKSLKDRVQPQSKQEWGRDDEQYLLVCKNALAKYQSTDKWDANIISRWLENRLRISQPQNHWKPTKEQLNALNTLNLHGDISYVGQQQQLISFYEQLKRL